MSSLEEINRKIEEVAKEIEKVAKKIGKVETAITTWENNSATKTNDYDFWKTEKKQLQTDKNNLQTEKNNLQAKENKLRDEMLLLLQRQSEWTYTQLVKWTNSYQLLLGENLSNKINGVSDAKESMMNSLEIKEWSTFDTHFDKFKKLTESKFKKTKFNSVSRSELDMEKITFRRITSHDNLQSNIMKILDASFIQRIFPLDKDLEKYSSGQFKPRSNRSLTYSDIYLELESKEQFLIAEVKTDKQLDSVPNTSLTSKLNDKSSDIYSAIAQVANDLYFSHHNPKVAVLTTYTKTWVVQLYQRSANDILTLISPMITNDNFFQAIYFVFSLLFEKVRNSINGWRLYITNAMIKDQTANNNILKRPGLSNGSNGHSNDNQPSKKQRPSNSNDSQPSKKTQQSTTVEADLDISDDNGVVDMNDVNWQDLLFDSIPKWKVIGYGLCGVVCRASIREHDYVIKNCSLTKSPKFALDELKNEHSILLQLKKIKEVADFVPSTYYYGNIWLQQLLVCDFIDGHVYDDFNKMDQRTKLACLARVKQLHASNVLHGDLRAPNFIVQPDNKVFVIDFGRSKILQENASIQEKEEFKKSLFTEMRHLKSHLK